jgi:two-component system, cell cycle response regulator DivK
VEDGRTYSELALVLLADLGYSVRHALTAEEGLRLARAAPPDVVLMDLNLPGMDGFGAVRLLRADPQLQHIPTIALTGDTRLNEQERLRAIEAGFDAYHTKPIDKAAFRAVLQPFLSPGEHAP